MCCVTSTDTYFVRLWLHRNKNNTLIEILLHKQDDMVNKIFSSHKKDKSIHYYFLPYHSKTVKAYTHAGDFTGFYHISSFPFNFISPTSSQQGQSAPASFNICQKRLSPQRLVPSAVVLILHHQSKIFNLNNTTAGSNRA